MTDAVEQLMTEIAKAFYREIGNAVTANYTVQMITDYAEAQGLSYDLNGTETTFVTKAHLTPLFERLREAMYTANPDQGAWYVAKLTIDDSGKFGYDFDYDDISQFTYPPTKEEIEEDLRQFPRLGKG